TFHFALNPGGYLFLGSSESVDGRTDLYTALGTDQHIFRTRPASGRSYPVPELGMSYTLEPLRLQATGGSGEVRQRERITFAELHQQLLEAYAPPSVVIDEEFDIVHLSPQAGRYLRLTGGEPTMNLLKVAREDIRLELRSALYHAHQTKTAVTALNLVVHGEEGEERIDIRVRPVLHPDDPARGFMLVVFEPSAEPIPVQTRPAPTAAPPITRQLEDEVGRLKAELRTSTQHHELQADKLKASNEELQAINEELRSSAEELETSKEELQSMNEELTTVNQELKIKIDELAHTSNDLQNLIKSTNIATLFLDRTFRVKLFTPTTRELFNLIPADVGRPLSDITTRLLDTDLPAHVENVLRDLQAIEREVRTTEGGVYMMRVLPYRTSEDRIGGVVITFIDITERKQAEEKLRASEADFRASFEVSSVGEAICDGVEARIVRANPAMCAMAGYECDELYDRPLMELAHAEDAAALGRAIEALANGSLRDYRAEVRFARRDGGEFWGDVAANLVRTVAEQPARILIVITDITDRRRAVEALSRGREELEQRVSERTAELAAANELLRQEALERDRAEQERLQLSRQLADAQENERRRLSRELHDQLGQEVSAITLKLAMLKSQPDLPPRAVEEIRQIESVAKQLDSDLDFLVWELRPVVLDDLGLAEALADYLANWSSHFGIEAEMHSKGSGRRVERDVETALYRIAQEALNNIAKHSGATKVELHLDWTASQVRLTIADNGRGFDAAAAAKRNTGLGLVGMRERATVVGGNFAVESSAASGTRLQVRVPIALEGVPPEGASARGER
ncbi:MAG TPA: PAS domain S-box protein, partial [Usitatibacter sp.]|nr:PAS domain S-box protein [Usitatibacter sp.]